MKQHLLLSILTAALIFPSFAFAEYVYYTTGTTSAIASSTTAAKTSAAPVSVPCTNLTINLHYLDTDSTTAGSVTLLQNFLHAGGYLKVTATGYYGPLTLDAVTVFQTQYGFVANPVGYVGPQTRGKIKELTCGAVPYTSTTSPMPAAAVYVPCASGENYNAMTGAKCTFTQTSTIQATTTVKIATTTTAKATTTATTTLSQNLLAPPTILPVIRITSVIPVGTKASTTRQAVIGWEAETISIVGLSLINNSTKSIINIATSTPNDGTQTVVLTSTVIPDGSYSIMVYWPTNILAGDLSPVGNVTVSSKLITINKYPAGTATSTANDYYSASDQYLATTDYVANIEESREQAEEDKKKVIEAESAEEKQNALQELCSGFWGYLDPAHCTAINLTGN